MSENRIIWIDYAKIIGIYLVVLAHTSLTKEVQNFIYTFHMPLFFFLSGYLFSSQKHPDFSAFYKRRFFQLIVPYIFFSIVTYLFWLVIGKNYGDDASENVAFYKPLIGIFYANPTPPYMAHCIPLWFLPCLYIVELLYFIISKMTKTKLMLFAFLPITSLLASLYITIPLPWGLNTAFVAILFYALGHVSKDYFYKIYDLVFSYKVALALVATIVVILTSMYNGRINMHAHYYGNFPLFIVGGFSGIFMTIITCLIISKVIKTNNLIKYYSQNTIIILGFHLMNASVIKGITYFIFKIPLEIYNDSLWINVVFSMGNMIILLPVIYLINQYMPFSIGRTKNISTKKTIMQPS